MPEENSKKKWATALTLLVSSLFFAFGACDFLSSDTISDQLLPSSEARRQLESSYYFDDAKDDDANPHFWKYSYVIVTYHKSGHELSHVLVKYLERMLEPFGGQLLRKSIRPRLDFNEVTKCSELSLAPGTVTVIEAPEFHCHQEQLAKILMDNPSKNPAHQKWGVKIIHLVRNPFTMAVSNYHYHQQYPTPEPFVHTVNPCQSLTEKRIGDGEHASSVLSTPILSQPHHKKHPIMTSEDFDHIVQDCYSIYQTRPDLVNSTYYEHLRTLDSREGLRMSTADKFNSIVLMASDLLMFNRVKRLQDERNAKHPRIKQKEHFDLITMPLDVWIDEPRQSMYTFLDFVFKDKISQEKKENQAVKYQDQFFAKIPTSNHITTGKYEDTDALIEYLREDDVFGGPLRRVEALLGEIVTGESMARREPATIVATPRYLKEQLRDFDTISRPGVRQEERNSKFWMD